jgi:hypothetical protein
MYNGHNIKNNNLENKMLIKEIQEQINKLQEQVNLLTIERTNFNWTDAPTICELNGSRWVLGPEAPEELNWNDAVDWCESVGGELPPRDILLHCYVNKEISDLFTATTYWSSTQWTATYAWTQYFNFGSQDYDCNKTYAYCVRAVRRLII